jgi:Cu2+-exporting ATPase
MTLQRHAEGIADRLVLPTFGVAGGAAFLASQIDRMTSVLITDFGTGIRIAVPTSALTAMTIAAREGVLVKGGQYLERLAAADVIVFDKTGTLTVGEPRVREVTSYGKLPLDRVMALAAAAEERQGHPVAVAIRDYAAERGLDVPAADLGSEEYTIGVGLRARVAGHDVLIGGRRLMVSRGVWFAHAQAKVERSQAEGVSSLYVAVDGALEAVIGYADAPRAESVSVVKALRAGGRRKVVLLSGDARGPVEAVGAAVGVDAAYGELLPEDKVRHVKELQREGKIVAMVGDGINDAPALAVADVGISLDGGADVALETADVVLLEGGLLKLPHAFEIADRAMAHVRRGLGLVIAPNAAAIVLGALGLITPGMAAVVNNGSTVIAALAAVSPLLRARRSAGGAR